MLMQFVCLQEDVLQRLLWLWWGKLWKKTSEHYLRTDETHWTLGLFTSVTLLHVKKKGTTTKHCENGLKKSQSSVQINELPSGKLTLPSKLPMFAGKYCQHCGFSIAMLVYWNGPFISFWGGNGMYFEFRRARWPKKHYAYTHIRWMYIHIFWVILFMNKTSN